MHTLIARIIKDPNKRISKIIHIISPISSPCSYKQKPQHIGMQYIAVEINGEQGGIILIDSQLHIINMYPKVYPLRRFLSNQMAIEMTRNTVE